VEEFAAMELAADLGLSWERGASLLADALDLRHRLPRVFVALGRGEVEPWRARLVARGTRKLSASVAAQVESEVLPQLATVTTVRVKKLVAAAVIAADPAQADQTHQDAAGQCEVTIGPSVNGVSGVYGCLETPGAIRLDARVDQVADWLIELGDERPKTVLRAAALALLADPGEVQRLWRRVCAHRAGTQTPSADAVPVPATTLYVHHRRDADGTTRWEAEGAGPITQAQAQQLVGTGFVTVKPVIDLAETITCDGYRASDGLREQTLLTMPTCNGPFCDRPARKGDFDHVIPAPEGATSSDNGALPCRRHHRGKTHGRWRLRMLARGAYLWRSPTNRLYLVTPRGTQALGKACGPDP
jgi:hypothetical protein